MRPRPTVIAVELGEPPGWERRTLGGLSLCFPSMCVLEVHCPRERKCTGRRWGHSRHRPCPLDQLMGTVLPQEGTGVAGENRWWARKGDHPVGALLRLERPPPAHPSCPRGQAGRGRDAKGVTVYRSILWNGGGLLLSVNMNIKPCPEEFVKSSF